ncbi:MAG: hypothetical protein WDZ64_01475 [Parcubacteria group bacterium]
MNNQFFTDREHEVRFFTVLLVALLFLLVVSLVSGIGDKRQDFSAPPDVYVLPFPEVDLVAKSAYVYDMRTKTVLFAQNEDERLPLASVSKVMSALVATQAGLPYDTVFVTGEALEVMGDSGLYRDERWSLKDILDFSLLTSSNDGMRAVALTLGALHELEATSSSAIEGFVLMMNNKARELGLSNSYFINETGLDESVSEAGAYSSVKDVNTLMDHVFMNYPEILEVTKESTIVSESLDRNVHIARNTNSIVGNIPGLLASKTGYTDLAGGNLTIIFDPEIGRPIIVTVMGSTAEGRFDDVYALVNATMKYISGNEQIVINEQ